MAAMKISQLAERSGVPATTLRYYESEGLLPADRTPSGYRTYGEGALERLAFISAAKHLGLALEEIRDLLGVWQDGPCSAVRASLRPMVSGRLADAEQRAAQMETFAASLRDALDRLDALPDRHTSCDPACPFLTGPAMPPTAGTSPWRQALDGASTTAIPGGWRLSLPAGRAAALASLAAAEQSRRPALAISLHLHGEHLHLDLTTSPEHDGLIDDLLGPTA
jgi:MerR family transcriptional regulator, copper efflux regulator